MDNGKQFNLESLLKNILAQKWPTQSNSVYYVSVFKQSQSGILYNERMLVLQDQTFTIFYTKYTKPLSLLLQIQDKGTKTIKERLNIINTTAIQEDNIITIYFIQDNVKKSWVFQFINKSIAGKWFFLFHQMQEKCVFKSIQSKKTKSRFSNSQSGSILSNYKYPNNILQELCEDQERNSFNADFQSQKKKKIVIERLQNS